VLNYYYNGGKELELIFFKDRRLTLASVILGILTMNMFCCGFPVELCRTCIWKKKNGKMCFLCWL